MNKVINLVFALDTNFIIFYFIIRGKLVENPRFLISKFYTRKVKYKLPS
jgi:hypothetical protein